jgi:thioredoxin-like negative regulator of GroEL
MTVTVGAEKRIAGRFGVTAIPTVALVDPQDRVLRQKSGYSLESFETILNDVSRIVKAAPPAK